MPNGCIVFSGSYTIDIYQKCERIYEKLKIGSVQIQKKMTREKARKLLKQIYRCRILYLMAMPPIIAVFIFHYIPIYGVQIAFKNYRSSLGITGSEWVGLEHFKTFISHPYFSRIMWNTLRISLVSLLFFPVAIIFAIMLNEMRQQKLKRVCQMITYAPHFVSTIVVCSITMLMLNKNSGIINALVELLGGERRDYMAIPSAFVWIYTLSGLWQGLGWSTIIYLASLAGVPQELIEAARIDGAGRIGTIWHVHLPHLKPTVFTLLILQMGSLASVGFEKVFALQNTLNMEASSVISTYTYEMGLINHDFSYSSAIGLFNNIINIILIITANNISKKVAEVSMW